jgi:hypothetical protein
MLRDDRQFLCLVPLAGAREYLAKSGKAVKEAAEKFRKTPLPFPEIKQ